MTTVAFFFIVLVAALLQAWLGFGFPVIAMIFLPMLFDYAKCVAIIQCVVMVSTIYLMVKHWKKIRWDVLLPLQIPAMIIGVIVTYYSMSVSSKILFILLGVMLFFIALYSLTIGQKFKIQPTVKNGVTMGVIAGVGNGLFSIGGPATAIYLLAALDDKVEYLACMQTFFTLCNIGSLTVRLAKGSLMLTDFPTIVVGWVAMLIGTFLGQKGFQKIDGERLKKAVYIFILLNGIWLIVSNLFLK